MKRFLLTGVALGASCLACAQSSVTLFGVIDTDVAGFRSQSDTPAGVSVTRSQTALTNSGYNSSRLGFRGTEDLGGGLAAGFWIEAGLATDAGTGSATGGGLAFTRRSTVSLISPLGELRLGRDYTPNFWNDNIFDPFGVNGVGTNLITNASGGVALGVPNSGFQSNANYARASNSVGYLLPDNLGGFYGQLLYAFNENTSVDPGGLTPPGVAAIVAKPSLAAVADNGRAGRYIGGRIGYATGPLNVALVYSSSTIGSNYYAGSTTNLNTWSIGSTYDFGVVKLFGEYSNNKQDTDLAINALNPLGVTKPGANGGLLGFTIPIGAGLIRASYSEVKYNNVNLFTTNPQASQYAVGYVYNLSKRTALYATYAYISNKNGAALVVTGAPTFYTGAVPGAVGAATPDKSYGYNLGIRHSF